MEQALIEFLKQTKGIDKALIGSYNLQLQGIEIPANDIDFVMHDEGIQKVAELFNAEINNEHGYNACEFALLGQTINCVSCEGNKLRLCDFMSQVTYVLIGDTEVPCMSLESELAFYKASGREKDLHKVSLIEAKLQG
jgi:uncharacterized iron-regulated protein